MGMIMRIWEVTSWEVSKQTSMIDDKKEYFLFVVASVL
jgi:hypothetical protein